MVSFIIWWSSRRRTIRRRTETRWSSRRHTIRRRTETQWSSRQRTIRRRTETRWSSRQRVIRYHIEIRWSSRRRVIRYRIETRWSSRRRCSSAVVSRPSPWLFAILAGLFGGLAILIKLVAAFFIISGGIGALLLGRKSLTEVLKQPQIYVMSALGILPGAAYIIYGIWVAGYLGQQFGGRFIPTYFLSPSYYLGWVNMLNIVIGGIPLMLALLGIFFFDKERRRFILALWAGYGIFGLYFNYHIASHDYYSLPLIPIAALSIAPLADKFFTQLKQFTPTRLLRVSAFGLLLLGLFMSLWNTRNQLNSVDYRPQAQMWAEIGQKVDGHNAAGLTQDYGSRMAYWGWVYVTSWPTYGDLLYHDNMLGAQQDFEEQFATLAAKKDLFIVTDFADLNLQPFLKEKLKTYPIFAEGDGYVIYNLMEASE